MTGLLESRGNPRFTHADFIPMQKVRFEDAVQRLVQKDTRFHPEAYNFIRETLDYTVRVMERPNEDPSRHVSGQELLDGFRQLAIEQFGPMATTVFEEWGVSCCQDVGDMVFGLIDEGVFGKSEDDELQDFSGGYDFFDAFVRPFLPRNPKRQLMA